MEVRKLKRGTLRESMNEYNDPEAGKGLDAVATNYSSMAGESAPTNTASDGILMAKSGEDSHLRSLVKGLTWRFVASGTTIVIAKVVTGETTIAFQIGFFEFFAKIGIYYVHERIWAKIKI